MPLAGKMQNKQKEIQFFDNFEANGYDVFNERGYNRLLAEFKKIVNPIPGEIVIDFGCGTGAFTNKLKKFGLDCTGIDISSKCIEYARKKNPGIKFEVQDIEKTNLRSNSADIVIFSGVLHHFSNFFSAVKEAHRVLRKGGRVFGYDPNKRNPIMWLYRDKKSPVHSTQGKTENERLLEAEEIYYVFKKAGFGHVVVRAVSDIGFKYVDSKIARLAIPLYNFTEYIADKTPFAKKYGSFLISKGEKL